MAHEVYFATPAQMRMYKARKIIEQVLLYTFLTIVGLFIVLPFFYMIITSFKSTSAYEAEQINGSLVLYLNKSNFSIEQYVKVLGKSGDFGTYYLNTIIVAVASTAFTLVTTVLASLTASAYSSMVLGPMSIPINPSGIS